MNLSARRGDFITRIDNLVVQTLVVPFAVIMLEILSDGRSLSIYRDTVVLDCPIQRPETR